MGRVAAAALTLILLAGAQGSALAETVIVKYRGPVDLAKFECTGELDSSVVKRVCYNAACLYVNPAKADLVPLLRDRPRHGVCPVGSRVKGNLL